MQLSPLKQRTLCLCCLDRGSSGCCQHVQKSLEDRRRPHKLCTALSLSDPQLSLMVKVVPSPDWFVGVDSINLCQGGRWEEEVTFDLQPYDAGTDSGFTFSSPNFPTSPAEKVTQVTHVLVVHELIGRLYERSGHSSWPAPHS